MKSRLLGAVCACISRGMKKGMESRLVAASLGAVFLSAAGPALAITFSHAIVSAEDTEAEPPTLIFFKEDGPLPFGERAFVTSDMQLWGAGVGEAEGVGSQTLKARASLSDFLSGFDDTVQALAQGDSTLNIGITAVTSGTMFFDLSLNATLTFEGSTSTTTGAASFVNYSAGLGTVGGAPGGPFTEFVIGASGEGILTGAGLGLFGTMQGGAIGDDVFALSAAPRVTFDLFEGTDYILVINLLAAVNSAFGEAMVGTASSFNSLGFPGEFWDVVDGTASFCETGNLDNCHGVVPNPPAIDIEKLTNGNDADGANDSDVPRILPGDFVTWTYQVTNTGDIDLSFDEISVTDDQPGVTPMIDLGTDTGTQMILSPGETWIYTATAQAVNLVDPPASVFFEPGCNDGRNTYVNVGSVEVNAGGETASDSDSSHYCNPGNADIDIRKQAEGPDTRTFPSSSDVTFEIVVTNEGAVDLDNVAVSDTNASSCENVIGPLAAGASVTYTCTATNMTESITNVACVVGTSLELITVEDCDPSTVDVNNPPDCSQAIASLDTLWPPNHKFVPINVLGITDPDGDLFTITIDSIFQDEPVNGRGDGDTSPDGKGVGSDTALVRAERSGTRRTPGNGRVYHIGIIAEDVEGESCTGEVLVGVPHDRNTAPVDDGAIYDSTVP